MSSRPPMEKPGGGSVPADSPRDLRLHRWALRRCSQLTVDSPIRKHIKHIRLCGIVVTFLIPGLSASARYAGKTF